MYRSPIAIVLAIVSAVLLLIGAVNKGEQWGPWLIVAGIAVLVVAGVVNVYLGRRRRSRP
jgi:drug/metabolite transporter (DMT)-like permease